MEIIWDEFNPLIAYNTGSSEPLDVFLMQEGTRADHHKILWGSTTTIEHNMNAEQITSESKLTCSNVHSTDILQIIVVASCYFSDYSYFTNIVNKPVQISSAVMQHCHYTTHGCQTSSRRSHDNYSSHVRHTFI